MPATASLERGPFFLSPAPGWSPSARSCSSNSLFSAGCKPLMSRAHLGVTRNFNKAPRPKGRGINSALEPNCLRPKGRGIEPEEIQVSKNRLQLEIIRLHIATRCMLFGYYFNPKPAVDYVRHSFRSSAGAGLRRFYAAEHTQSTMGCNFDQVDLPGRQAPA